MGIVRFCILFDKPDSVYYPGEMVTGRVELVLNSIMEILGVELKIKGKGMCGWSETAGRHTEFRENSEIYFKHEQILIGGRDKLFKLHAGEYTYPFSVMLPLKAPSSFVGSYGGTFYYARAKIHIPLVSDKKERTIFTVINPLNLNLFPKLWKPYKTEKSKTFYCLWCVKGQCTIAVHLPRTGFYATESIPITLEIDNASNVTINAVYVQLKRKICYTSEDDWVCCCIDEGKQKHEECELPKLRLGRVEEGQSQTWSENFTIPSASFPNLTTCIFIKIDYELHIEADASCMHFNLKMDIPVTIADAPTIENSEAPIITPQMQTFPNIARNPGMQVPAEAPSLYPNHNPPAKNLSHPLKNGDAPLEVPLLQICPTAPPGHVVPQPGINNASPNSGFVMPSPHPNAGGMPQMPTQENSAPVQQYPSQTPAALPVLSPKLATNPESSQNLPHPPVAADADTGYGLALPLFNSDVQLENTSCLNDSKGQNAENTPLPPFSRMSRSEQEWLSTLEVYSKSQGNNFQA